MPPDLARIPAKWNRFADKDSRQINILEQILIAKVFNFGGICSKGQKRPADVIGAAVEVRKIATGEPSGAESRTAPALSEAGNFKLGQCPSWMLIDIVLDVTRNQKASEHTEMQ